MIRALAKRLGNLGIRSKLFITYLGLVTVPIFLLLFINLYFTSRDSEQQAKLTMSQVMNQTVSIIEFKTESINNILNVLALNDTLQELTQKSKGYYDENIGNWIVDDQKLTKALYFTSENPNISARHFYMEEGLAAAAETDEYRRLRSVTGADWYREFIDGKYEPRWFPGGEIEPGSGAQFIAAVKGIPSSQSINEITGIIRLDIPLGVLKTALDQSLFTKSTSAFLINSGGEVLCSSGSLPADAGELAGLLPAAAAGAGGWQTVRVNGGEYLLGVHSVRYTDWKLVLAEPYRDILAFNISARNQMILIFLIVAPLTLPLSLLVSNSATKRIRRLIAHMRKAERGDFGAGVPTGNNDEIGQLTNSFNYMLKRMEGLMEDKFTLGREMKNLEIKALQAQINPHFLYNTLDLINWMSVRSGAPEISRLAEALGRFYKLSLSRGEDIVSIGNELEHVRSYVQIQNMRFGDNVALEIDVPEEVRRYSIVKLVLQPIVENAVLHGIMEKDEEKGTIRISGALESGTVSLEVRDDGIGMPDDRIREILSGESTLEPHGYGVHNINERLRLHYGEAYGLTFESVVGEYTVARIRIPAIPYGREA